MDGMKTIKQGRMFLWDGSGYLYRAFYGVRELARKDGFPTNAIYGFVRMLQKMLTVHRPDYGAMVFDLSAPTFRHRLDPAYKAQRKPMPEELRAQVPIIRAIISAYHIPILEQEGFEADDLLGSLACLANATPEAGVETVIVSVDKDLMQLVRPGVTLWDPVKERVIGREEVIAFWGVPPEQVVEVMALAGDSSDNIPGVPGIGVTTAAALIREYGTLEKLLENADRITQPKRRESLRTYAEQARRCHRLARIDEQVPMTVGLEDLATVTPDWEQVRRLLVEMEFTSLVKELDRDHPPPVMPNASGVTSGGEALRIVTSDYRALTTWEAFLAWCEQLRGVKALALDTETTDVDPVRAELVGLSFSWMEGQAWYLPVGHLKAAAPDGQLPLLPVLAALRPVLEDPSVAKTGQNLKYDFVVLRKYGIRLAGMVWDSMIMSHLLYGTHRRHNLGVIALEELGRTTTSYEQVVGSGRGQRRFDEVPLAEAVPYACEDAEVAWAAAKLLATRLAATPALESLYREVEGPLVTILGEMEWTGILVDREVLQRMSADFTQRREQLTDAIHQLAGEVFNVNSTQQLGGILFDKLGIKGGKKTQTGYSTDAEVLRDLAAAGHPLPAKVLNYRTLTKLQSTYTDALMTLIHPDSGRVHTSFNQAVTLTGRLSSSKPNLQNIPIRSEEGREIRSAFVAPEGWRLLSADYSQVELRLLAHLADVRPLQEVFRQGGDVHAATAVELFGGRQAEVTPEQRRMAKTINFGLIYGMSAFGLARRLGLPQVVARRFMASYFARYAGVKAYMDRAIGLARERGWAETLLGRRCAIREINSANRTLREEAERTAINAPIQGSAADLIKVATVRLHQALQAERLRSRLVLQVHDELVLEVPEEEMAQVTALVREAMEGAATLSVPLVVDIGSGRHWGEAH